ncbi:MAG TPA: hypothetical protein ENJ10_14885 [Caldithrix abyssi]|uniref:YtxH domain-containing protein n=1 Tax=Caldithrix abyssi TaxID=187145 RepID=A0A7V1LPV8_CALAY|nr:hypothetical protein [Caldithrix abyssi]
MSSENGSGFFSGLIVGGAIGLIAGVLFAPKSGRDIREELFNDSDDIIKKAKEELDKIYEELSELKNKVGGVEKSMKTAPAETAEERAFEESLNSIDEETDSEETKTKES